MAHLHVSDLAYAHPGGDLLFHDVSFRLPPGGTSGIVGANGVGKSTLLRVLAGELRADEGDASVGGRVALHAPGRRHAATRHRARAAAGRRARARCAPRASAMLAAERALAAGDDDAPACELGEAIGEWSDARRLRARGPVGRRLPADRRAAALERGRRPRRPSRSRAASASGSCSTCCSPPTPTCCCSTSPTTSSTSPPSASSSARSRATQKTILLISHDRELLTAAVRLDRHARGQRRLGARRLLRDLPRGARAPPAADGRRASSAGRRRSAACASSCGRSRSAPSTRPTGPRRPTPMETRWRRFVDEGPPPAPVVDQQIKVRLRGGDSRAARRRAQATSAIDGLVRAVHRGGPLRRARRRSSAPTARGKTHLMRAARRRARSRTTARCVLGTARLARPLHAAQRARRTSPGATSLDVVRRARSARWSRRWARSPATAWPRRAQRSYDDAQRAARRRAWRSSASSSRATTCCCSTSRPTTSTSTPREALETALDGFEGTVVAVSHDRAFLRTLDRFLLLDHDGDVDASCPTRTPRWWRWGRSCGPNVLRVGP